MFIVLSAFAVISISLTSGLFLTFSDFLMRSFNRAAPAAGIEAMQVLNREIWKSITMVLLWGNVALSTGLAFYAWLNQMEQVSVFMMLGAALYIFGVLVLSFTANVPMNNRLDRMDFRSAEAQIYWQQVYVPRWVFWNWLRAIATTLSATSFLVATMLLSSSLF
jgi:uncharacterized membrane protein